MTDNRSITINLKLTGDDTGSTDSSSNTQTSNFSGEDKNSKAKAAALALASQALSAAANEVVAWAEYYWNRELTLNDDYIGQRNKQIAMTQINRGIGVVSGILSATASGAAVGGWVGAIVGAVIGTATQTANIVRSNVQGKDQQDIMLRQMNASLDFTRSRSGWSTKAASIGEDL